MSERYAADLVNGDIDVLPAAFLDHFQSAIICDDAFAAPESARYPIDHHVADVISSKLALACLCFTYESASLLKCTNRLCLTVSRYLPCGGCSGVLEVVMSNDPQWMTDKISSVKLNFKLTQQAH